MCLSPDISCDLIYGVVALCSLNPKSWSAKETNSTDEPLAAKNPAWSVAAFSKYLYAYTFLPPSGDSPNTSEISLPDDGMIDADTDVPTSEPLILNVDDEI